MTQFFEGDSHRKFIGEKEQIVTRSTEELEVTL
jgi:hypothetical protein